MIGARFMMRGDNNSVVLSLLIVAMNRTEFGMQIELLFGSPNFNCFFSMIVRHR